MAFAGAQSRSGVAKTIQTETGEASRSPSSIKVWACPSEWVDGNTSFFGVAIASDCTNSVRLSLLGQFQLLQGRLGV